MPPIVVFDLDGTLALDAHRAIYLQKSPKDWDRYFDLCHLDEPNLPIIETFENLAVSWEVEIWTGRSAQVRGKTEDWIARCFAIPPSRLRMREADDRTQDDELKRQWLYESRAAGRNVMLAFEDRTRVVEMWRAEGVVCCQVAKGDF